MKANGSEITKKRFLNVDVLDLRRATEASIGQIEAVSNVGTLLYSSETARLVTHFSMLNVDNTMEVPADAKIITGEVVFNRDYFKGQEAPLDAVITGRLVVNPDVPAEDIERGLGTLHVAGQIICPEPLLGILQSKAKTILGQTISYPSAGRLIKDRVTLDENYLHALADASELVIIGDLHLPQVLSNDLLAQKVQTLHITGQLRYHEENARTLLALMPDKPKRITTIPAIPAGFELVDRPLVMDNAFLETLPAKRLYCPHQVQVATDVTPSLLDERLEALSSTGMVLCPLGLKDVLARKCNPLETQITIYEGELWFVDSVLDLAASRFDYLEGKATVIVNGVLTVDPETDAQVLADRLAKVHNYGVIHCAPEQLGAIQARMGINTGVLESVSEPTVSEPTDSEPTDDQSDETPAQSRQIIRIANVGYLAL